MACCSGRNSKGDAEAPREVGLSCKATASPARRVLAHRRVRAQAVATRRRCRDVVFLLVWLAFWGGMGYIA